MRQRQIRYFFLLPLLFLCAACGGGSSGTGVQGTSYEGNLLDANSLPIAGAQVLNEQTGETVVTDEAGHFHIGVDSAVATNTLAVGGSIPSIPIEIQVSPPDMPTPSETAAGAPSGIHVVGMIVTQD